jgi:hypothetical protein
MALRATLECDLVRQDLGTYRTDGANRGAAIGKRQPPEGPSFVSASGLPVLPSSALSAEKFWLLEVTIRKSCGARPDIYGLTCALTFSNHTISEYLLLE